MSAYLTLFGSMRMVTSDSSLGTPVVLSSRPLSLLLAYLALHPRQPVDRRHLAFLLWPDQPESQALQSLRHQLHSLRRLLNRAGLPQDLLQVQPGQLRFQPGSRLWIDVDAFRHLARSPRGWAQAVALYRDHLLVDFPDVAWLEPIRAQLREECAALLERLIQGAQAHRDGERLLAFTGQLVALRPLSERAHRLHIQALLAQGRQAEARAHFLAWRERLQREFQAAPGPEIRALVAPLLAGNGALAPSAEPEETPLPATFVGRRAELARLDRALAQAQEAQGGFLLVCGQNGLGRTHLLECWLASRSDRLLAFQARCTEEVTGPGLLLAALRSNRQAIDWSWLPAQFPGLAQLQEQIQGDGPAEDLSGEPLLQLIFTLARRSPQPVTLVLYDLHKASAETWTLLASLASRCQGLPLLFLATCQLASVNESGRRRLLALQRQAWVDLLHLRPFTREETAQLARAILGKELPHPLLEALHQVTEGFPYFIVAYLEEMRARERLAEGLPATPRPVQEVMRGCFAQLDPRGQLLLAAAARLGPVFDAGHLAAYTPQLSEEERLEALEQGLRRGLLRETSQGYTFTHCQVRQAARSLLPLAREME